MTEVLERFFLEFGSRFGGPQLRLDLSLWRFATQLQAHIAVEPTDQLDIDHPSPPSQQDMSPPVPAMHARLGYRPPAPVMIKPEPIPLDQSPEMQ